MAWVTGIYKFPLIRYIVLTISQSRHVVSSKYNHLKEHLSQLEHSLFQKRIERTQNTSWTIRIVQECDLLALIHSLTGLLLEKPIHSFDHSKDSELLSLNVIKTSGSLYDKRLLIDTPDDDIIEVLI